MKIMAAYDGSNVAKEAVVVTQRHARAFGAEVHLVTSISGGSEVPRETFVQTERDLDQLQQEYFDANGIACHTHALFRGLTPGEDLVRFAEENGIDQIVMGVKRRSKVGKLLFGSTAQYVILNAPCPVLTVR